MRTELKRLRVSNFLTQEQMATIGGVSRTQYSFIEQGKRKGDIDFWFALQKKFNLSIEELDRLRQVETG